MPEVKIKRKLFRLVGLLFPILYALGDFIVPGTGWIAATAVLVSFLGIMFTLEYARFSRPGVNRWLFDHFRSFTKEKERARTSSTTFFLLACLLTILLFNKGVAIAAMLMLVFGDPVAEMVGTRWGRTPLMGKSLQGTLGGLCACLIAATPLILAPLGLGAVVIVAGALAATLFELIPLPIDDNFSIPLGAGAVMTLVQAFASGGGRVVLSPLLQRALVEAIR
jgi:dolichol kinase